MSMSIRPLWRIGVPLLVAASVVGCAGGTHSSTRTEAAAKRSDPMDADIAAALPSPGGAVRRGPVIARIGAQHVLKSEFDGRLLVEARAESPQHPIVPVPPRYTSCIEALATAASPPGAARKSAPRGQLKAECAQLFVKFRKHVLEELIAQYWIIGGAGEMGFHVSVQEARKRLQELRVEQYSTPSKFQQFLAATGESVPDLLFNVKVELLAIKIHHAIKASVLSGTEAEIARYYSTHTAQFSLPEERDIGIVRARSIATAMKAKAELESGKSFSSVAEHIGHQPIFLVAGKGLLKGLKSGIFHEKALNSAIFAAKAHVISGPVRVNLFPGYHPRFHQNPNDINNIDGYYVFEVEGIHPRHVRPLSEIAPSLKRELPESLYRQALVKFIKPWRSRWQARTNCAAGYVVRKCRQYQSAKGEEPEDPYTLS